MGLITEFRLRSRHVVGPILGISAVVYFAYHAVEGDRGLIAWWNLKQQVASAQARFDDLSAQRVVLQHRVGLLHPENLDPDMLDERARLMLNYGQPGDIVIFPKTNESPDNG